MYTIQESTPESQHIRACLPWHNVTQVDAYAEDRAANDVKAVCKHVTSSYRLWSRRILTDTEAISVRVYV